MTGLPKTLAVLIVCDGNVCRSPAMHFAISSRAPAVDVRSAGLHTVSGLMLCSLVADRIDDEFAGSFRSTRVAELEVDRFDLVLSATVGQRSELARAHPRLRERFFTVRRASHLLASLDKSVRGEEIVAAMNRDLSVSSIDPTRLPGIPIKGANLLDIPDAHNARSRAHAAVVTIALATGASIGDSLARLTAEEAPR